MLCIAFVCFLIRTECDIVRQISSQLYVGCLLIVFAGILFVFYCALYFCCLPFGCLWIVFRLSFDYVLVVFRLPFDCHCLNFLC